MANFQSVETQLLAFTNTADAEATFDGGINGCSLSATADVYVDFDQATDAGSFLLPKDIPFGPIEFPRGTVQKIHAKGVSGSGNLHILGIR